MNYGFNDCKKKVEVVTKEEHEKSNWITFLPIGNADYTHISKAHMCVQPVQYMFSGNMIIIRGAIQITRPTSINDYLAILLPPEIIEKVSTNYHFAIKNGIIEVVMNHRYPQLQLRRTVTGANILSEYNFVLNIPMD